MLHVDILALDHSFSKSAGLTVRVLHRLGGVDGLRGVYTDQSDLLVAVQDEGVSVDHSGDGAEIEVIGEVRCCCGCYVAS